MKKIILLFVFFIAVQGFAQSNGINYQAVIMNPKGEQMPGVNNANSPVVNKNICMVFKFIDEFSNIEYQETVQTKTDGFGMVNLVIGKGTQTAGYAASFQSIVWSSAKKSLVVGINTNGNCATYTEISNQEFSYAPLAFSAINAENVTGVVAIENGGTNATTVLGAKTNLGLENVDNTTDLNKPISAAVQAALNLKEDFVNKSIDIVVDGNSDLKYPTVKSVKTYVDASAILSSTALTNEISRATTAENTIAANLVTETNNRTAANNTLATNLATEVSNRTAADLLKEDVANKSTNVTTDGTSDTKYPSVKSVKTYVDASTASASTALANEVTRATAAENTIAVNLTAETLARTLADNTLTTNLNTETSARTSADGTLTTNLAIEITNRTAVDLLKEDVANKSTNVTTDGTSDTKYPSVKSVKTYVDASTASASTALANEVTRATAAENTIAANLTAETSARTLADNTLTTNLNTEISARISADGTLTTNLATEVSNRTAADLLKEDVANKSTDVTTDGTSDTKYPSVKSVKTYVDAAATTASTALATEITRATNAENAIAANLVTETTNRTNADNTLTTNLASEVDRATDAEDAIAANLLTETTNRTNADDTLTTNLASEVDRATDAEDAIAVNLLTETTNRTNADDTLTTNLATEVGRATDAEDAIAANLLTETTNRTNADDTLTTNLASEVDRATDAEDAIAANLLTETNSRSNADTTLQTNIDAVQAGVDANEASVTAALNLKAPLASPALIGTPTAPTATTGTNTTQIATTAFVTDAITTSANNFLPLTGGTLSGTLNGVQGDFSSNFKAVSFTLNGSSVWEFGTNGASFNLAQGGCCNRLTIDTYGRFGIGANYTPSYQLDVEGDGRFTSSVTATSFIKTGGTSSQFLKADGSIDSGSYATLASPALTGTPTAPTATAGTNTTQIATTEFVANAVSYATTGSFVDLTTNQTVAGTKIFSSNMNINGVTIGKNGSQSMIIGESTYSGTDGNVTAVGFMALNGNSGANNTALGSNALRNSGATSYNTAIGLEAGSSVNTGGYNTLLGYSAKTNSATPTITNAAAIGNGATVNASNTIQLGNTSVTSVNTSAAVTANSFVKSGGTSSQYLMADGSVSAGAAAVREVADEFTATAAQTSFTLTQIPSANSKVKMYINGIRISNTAYSVSGTTLTYVPANNGSYALTAGDRIQMDFYY